MAREDRYMIILTCGFVVQVSPKPDVEDLRYDAESASSNEKLVENGSEKRTSPSTDSSCSGSAVSTPEPEPVKHSTTSVRHHTISYLVCLMYTNTAIV